VVVEGRAEFPLKPLPFAETLQKFIDRDGVRIVGGCCGTTAEHIRLLVEGVAEPGKAQSSKLKAQRKLNAQTLNWQSEGKSAGAPAQSKTSGDLPKLDRPHVFCFHSRDGRISFHGCLRRMRPGRPPTRSSRGSSIPCWTC
jgi:hypothetical protein